MKKHQTTKYLAIIILYSIIVLSVNAVATVLLSKLGENIRMNLTLIENVMLDKYPFIIAISYLVAFGIPTIILFFHIVKIGRYILYKTGTKTTIPEKYQADPSQYELISKRRILNMTLLYASTSILGWLLALIFSFLAPKIVQIEAESYYYIYSFIYYMLSGLLCFVLVYYILEFIHRKTLVPFIFEGNEIPNIPGVIRLGLRKRLLLLFLTTVFTPMFFLFSIFMKINYDMLPGVFSDMFLLVTLFIIGFLIFGLLITIFLARSIREPVEEMMDATKNIQNDNYDIQIQVISTDEISQLAMGMNLMADKIREDQSKLKKYNVFLEELVEQRSRDLIQAEKMASLGELTAGIAHEIKNPLNFINNFSSISIELMEEIEDILKDKTDPETLSEINDIKSDLKHNLQLIHNHGIRADGIIKSMLDHTRETSGERTPTNLNQLIIESFELSYNGFRAKYTDYTTAINWELDSNLSEIQAVSGDLSRVFINLFQNAFYITAWFQSEKQDYEPSIKVISKKIKNSVEVIIQDNGPGIPSVIMDKIFNPFFTTKPTGEGVGLGLSICYDIIVQEHKGDIRVESSTDAGQSFTKFIITLPVNIH